MGGAGGVCSPAVLASLVLLCAGVVVEVIGVLWVTVPRLVVGGVSGGVDIAVGVGGVAAADSEGVTVVAGVSRGGLMAWVLLVLVLGAACVLMFGGFWACHSWLVFGWLVVLVVSVVSGVGIFLSAVLGSVVTGVASVVVEGVNAAGGWRCRCAAAVGGAGVGVGRGAAGGAVSVGVVGCCRCCPGGVLTAEGGPRHSWRRFPCATLAGGLALAPSVSLLPMVSYRVVSPWWLSLTLRVAVGEVALSVVPSLIPVVRSLRALLWFTASLMLLMLLVVGVGLCVGCQWLLLLLVVVLGAGRWVAWL